MVEWYVTCDPLASDKSPESPIWTVSRDPLRTGWETDSGARGYGLTWADAQWLAHSANLDCSHKMGLRTAIKQTAEILQANEK